MSTRQSDLERLFGEIKEKMYGFLTEQKDESRDMNARIGSEETLKALQLWRMLESKGVKEAGEMANTLERLSVSIGGEGRKEVTDAIKKVPSVQRSKNRTGGVLMREKEEREERE